MTIHIPHFISRHVRTAAILLCSHRRNKCYDQPEAKVTHRKPKHRRIVFFEMP